MTRNLLQVVPYRRNQQNYRVASHLLVDLGHTVTSLTRSIQDGTAALKDLQAAVCAEGAGSDTFLKRLPESCETFREEWRKFVLILQQCHGYADDYVEFCDYSSTHSTAESLVHVEDLQSTAVKLQKDIQDIKIKPREEFTALCDYLSLMFDQSKRARSKRANQPVQVAGSTVDGPYALRISRTTPDAISRSLTELTAFWEGQIQHLSAIISKPQDKFPTHRELGELLQRWKHYEEVIQTSVSSISVSLCAVKVSKDAAAKNAGEVAGEEFAEEATPLDEFAGKDMVAKDKAAAKDSANTPGGFFAMRKMRLPLVFPDWATMGNVFSQSLDLSDKDLIVVVIGQANAGKSSFINAATGSNLPVGHNLQCCTKKVQSVTAAWRGRKIVFVDTPAFDIDIDVNAEANLRRKIEKWQKKTSTQNHVVAGIIYLHKISETRITEPPHKRIKTFERLCGGSMSEKVLLVTTMWNEVDQTVGMNREQQIRANYWESPTTNRATMARFDDETDSTQAWRAVDLLLEGSGTDATRR